MKKFKLFNILLIIMLVFSMPVVYAHDVAVDKTNIKIEEVDDKIYSGSKIIVNSEALGIDKYEIYYQYVPISDAAYESYDETLQAQIAASNEFLKEKNITDINDADAEDKKDYFDAMEAYEESKEKELPTYVEANWLKSTDGTAPFDLDKLPDGEKEEYPYVLWIRVKGSDEAAGAVYSTKVVIVSNEKEDSELEEENAKTGDEILFVGLGIAVVAGVMIISYKKVNA